MRTTDAELLLSVTSSAMRQLDDVRLPLHILLENHFGDLNENQEEMLGAARSGAEHMAAELEALSDLARLELGQLTLRSDRAFLADLLNAILPVIRAHASSRDINLVAEIAPLLPALHVDAARLQLALHQLFVASLRTIAPASTVHLRMFQDATHVVLQMMPVGAPDSTARSLLAERVIAAGGAQIVRTCDALSISFALAGQPIAMRVASSSIARPSP